MFNVVVTEKGGGHQRFEFSKDTVFIGRIHGNDVVLPRGNVSKQHSKLQFKDGGFVVTDLESTNGTYVNGRRIFNPQKITAKDKIYVGDFILHVEYGDNMPQRNSEDKDSAPKNPIMTTGEFQGDTHPSLPAELRQTGDKASERRSRASAPPPPPRVSDKPTEKRVPLPSPSIPPQSAAVAVVPKRPAVVAAKSAVPSAAPSVSPSTAPDEDVSKVIEKLQARAEEALSLPEGSRRQVDPKIAAKARGVIRELVDRYVEGVSGTPLKPPGMLKGIVFRRVVEQGPLANWMEDPGITAIRIKGPKGISLSTDGRWRDADKGFDDEAHLGRVIECLGAGVDISDATVPGTKRYLSDEGYHVLTSTVGGDRAVVIDKTVAMGLEAGVSGVVDDTGLAVLRTAIDSEAKIAILGRSPSARQLVFHHLLGLLPEQNLVVSLEALPMPLGFKGHRLQIPCGSTAEGGFFAALAQGLALEPDWLALGGIWGRAVPDIISAAVGRLAFIADLPLSALGPIEKELATVMTAAGVSVSGITAASLLDAAFDIVIIVDRARSGEVHIKQVMASELSDRGTWSPRVLFGADKVG